MSYLVLIFSYLIGSISFAIVVSRLYNMGDPRRYGSNNAGATNVMRSGNKKAALFTLIGDLLKGTVAVIIARYIYMSAPNSNEVQAIIALCGILVVIGHIYPIFFQFKGGKGVATTLGVLLGFNPILALLVAITWLIVFKLSKVSSLAALVAALLSPVYAYILFGNTPYFGATFLLAFFIFYTHKTNIVRLIKAKENKF